ncbi:MAG TPA: NADH-quinone oxidoreductase subunit L [Actinomycetes bacterium]|nr:NADH-quinone oxidoreductase subunit L [Actinomycetes bacterium]
MEEVQAATGIFTQAWLLVAIPLVSAGILLLAGRRSNSWGHLLGVAAPLASFVLGAAMFFAMLGNPGEERAFTDNIFTWVPVAGFQVEFGTLIDQLSIVFVLLITGVGSLIHIYSIGYMAHDPDRRRFFAYMNLFIAAMLLLVIANDYLVLYVGWEGVGLASYLLIGFWYYKPSAATAAKKAFVVNRVGDVGMSLAIMVMFATFGATNFLGVFEGAPEATEGAMTAVGLLLLLAACGKSAQVPLQSWLLDAMEGPTPVSALIHAATMVTAGVYLITRSNAIFNAAPIALVAVAVVGAVTLLVGAIIGCAKDDIKKALAASTMSQIGYMVLAAGLGPAGYALAIFHLLMHGFFKANMFLGAGSVMHGMNDDVNMRHYGGLRSAMPITFVTFTMGYLAIIGIPPFDGFFSKDRIIEAALADNIWLGIVAMIGAGITAFYMTRLMLMTFFGQRRWREGVHPHESPPVMLGPMIVLGALSLFGAIAVTGNNLIAFLEPVVGEEEHELPVPAWTISVLVLALVFVGIAIAYAFFGRRPIPDEAPVAVSPVTVAARKDLYGDVINEEGVMVPGQYLTRSLVYFDNRGVDGAVNGLAAMFGGSSGRIRRWQTGFVRSYALSMFGGAAIVVVALLLVRLS